MYAGAWQSSEGRHAFSSSNVHFVHAYMDTQTDILYVDTLTTSLVAGQRWWARSFKATRRLTGQRSRIPSPSASSSGYHPYVSVYIFM